MVYQVAFGAAAAEQDYFNSDFIIATRGTPTVYIGPGFPSQPSESPSDIAMAKRASRGTVSWSPFPFSLLANSLSALCRFCHDARSHTALREGAASNQPYS